MKFLGKQLQSDSGVYSNGILCSRETRRGSLNCSIVDDKLSCIEKLETNNFVSPGTVEVTTQNNAADNLPGATLNADSEN